MPPRQFSDTRYVRVGMRPRWHIGGVESFRCQPRKDSIIVLRHGNAKGFPGEAERTGGSGRFLRRSLDKEGIAASPPNSG
jgi:hypothetical protein